MLHRKSFAVLTIAALILVYGNLAYPWGGVVIPLKGYGSLVTCSDPDPSKGTITADPSTGTVEQHYKDITCCSFDNETDPTNPNPPIRGCATFDFDYVLTGANVSQSESESERVCTTTYADDCDAATDLTATLQQTGANTSQGPAGLCVDGNGNSIYCTLTYCNLANFYKGHTLTSACSAIFGADDTYSSGQMLSFTTTNKEGCNANDAQIEPGPKHARFLFTETPDQSCVTKVKGVFTGKYSSEKAIANFNARISFSDPVNINTDNSTDSGKDKLTIYTGQYGGDYLDATTVKNPLVENNAPISCSNTDVDHDGDDDRVCTYLASPISLALLSHVINGTVVVHMIGATTAGTGVRGEVTVRVNGPSAP